MDTEKRQNALLQKFYHKKINSELMMQKPAKIAAMKLEETTGYLTVSETADNITPMKKAMNLLFQDAYD